MEQFIKQALNFFIVSCVNHLLGGAPMVSENSFMAQLIGIGIFEPRVSRIVNILQRTKADVSALIDPSVGGQQCVVSF